MQVPTKWLLDVYTRADSENRQLISELMLPAPSGVLLDVGCAGGEDAARLRDVTGAAHAIGLELSDHLIEAAKGRALEIRRADLEQPWPVETESVDAVHSNQVIEHLAATDHFMREVRRVLKPGGYAVLSTNNLSSWHNVAALVFGWQPLPCHVSDELGALGSPFTLGDEGAYGEGTKRHLRLFTAGALSQLATHHGLSLDCGVASGYYPLRSRSARFMARHDPRHAVYLVHRYGRRY